MVDPSASLTAPRSGTSATPRLGVKAASHGLPGAPSSSAAVPFVPQRSLKPPPNEAVPAGRGGLASGERRRTITALSDEPASTRSTSHRASGRSATGAAQTGPAQTRQAQTGQAPTGRRAGRRAGRAVARVNTTSSGGAARVPVGVPKPAASGETADVWPFVGIPIGAPADGPHSEPPVQGDIERALAATARPPAASFGQPLHQEYPDSDMHRWLEFGPLAPYLANERVTDLFVNGEAGLWTDDGARLSQQESWQADERSLRELAVRLISLGGRHIDEATPCVDVRLHDGVRVHAVLPPVSTTGTLLSVRVPRHTRFRLTELIAAGTLTAPEHARLLRAISRRENVLITGAAGSGKTTLLSAFLGEAPAGERIVTIEDVAELRIQHPHVVSLESRQPNLEGAGAIGMQRLVREALRMRPDRLVLGECRGAEIRELLAALNTGHDGGAGTLHANSLTDVPARIEALGALAGMTQEAVARQTVSAIGLVLHLERAGGVRRLAQIGRFRLDDRGQLLVDEEAVE